MARAVSTRLNPPPPPPPKNWDIRTNIGSAPPNPDPPPPPPPPPGSQPPVWDLKSELEKGGGVLADLKPLRGFFSYSRVDDRFNAKALSTLREKIQQELHMRVGREVEVWQDTHDIRSGAPWEAEIKRGITSSVFFIPIVTPNSINSPKCSFEFNAFREQERAIQQTDLIFPIIYIDVWRLARRYFKWVN